MIKYDYEITVNGNQAKLNKDIYLFRGNKNVHYYFAVKNASFNFKGSTDLIEKTNAINAAVTVIKPNNVEVASAIAKIENEKIHLKVTEDLIDEEVEVGDFDLVFDLFDDTDGAVTIPKVIGQFHVLERPCTTPISELVATNTTNEVDQALTDYAIVTYAEPVASTNADGTFAKKTWVAKEKITTAELNRMEEGISDVSSQCKDIADKINNIENGSGQGISQADIYERARGKVNLFIETPFEGGNQPYHPSVVAFDSAWNGYKYWMAYTPYPYGNDPAENPCIVASNDLLYWEEPSGITNPIDSPSQATDLGITYWSDTELIYNSTDNKLECWYRGIGSTNLWVRKTSSNGVTWSERENLHTFSGTGTVSASVILEDGTYKIWIMSPNSYYETTDATNWGEPTTFTTEGINYWHFQVRKTTKGYEMFAHVNWPHNLSIVHLASTDGITFTGTKKIISSNGDMNKPYGIDAKGIYRPCFIVLNNRYYLFYCTGANDIRKGITLSISDNLDLDTFRGIDASDEQYMKKVTKLSKYGFERLIFNESDNSLYYCPSPSTTKGQSCTWIKIGSSSGDIDTSVVQIGYLDSTGNFKPSPNGFIMDYMQVTSNANYTITDVSSKATSCKVAEYDNNKDFIKRDVLTWDNYSTEFTTSSNTAYIRVMFDYMNAQTSDANYITITKNNKYSITNNLTNCITNNSITSVDKNASYTSTISANNGYTLSSITVTMGGVDITSTAVTENTINISSVTGNIIITANAISLSGDKEVDISNVTWVNGYINANGEVVSANAGLVSDFIQLEGGSTYAITDTNNYVTNIKIAEYDNSKVLVQRQIDKFNSGTHSATVTLSSTTTYIRISIEISKGSIDSNAKNYITIVKI